MAFYLMLGATLGLAAAWMPGPLAVFLVSQSLSRGWRRTLPMALAPLVSDGPIAALVLLALTQVPPWLERALRLGGGFFLVYLACSAFKEWRSFDSIAGKRRNPKASGLLKAAAVNWLNPNPYLGWSLVLGPLFLAGWRESPANSASLLLGFYGAMAVSLAAIIVLASAADRLGPSVNKALLLLSSLGLAAFGVYQFWTAGSGLPIGF